MTVQETRWMLRGIVLGAAVGLWGASGFSTSSSWQLPNPIQGIAYGIAAFFVCRTIGVAKEANRIRARADDEQIRTAVIETERRTRHFANSPNPQDWSLYPPNEGPVYRRSRES